MEIDGPVIARLAQKRDQALALAKAIDADLVRAVGKIGERLQQLCDLAVIGLVAIDRKPECRLGDEEIAGDKLEACAGRVAPALVVARDHRPPAAMVDHHLGRAENVSGGNERHRYVADPDWPPVVEWLEGCPCPRPEPQLHDVDRIGRRQHRIVAGPRMVRVAMGDDSARHRRMRVDMEVSRHAIKPMLIGAEPTFEGRIGGHDAGYVMPERRTCKDGVRLNAKRETRCRGLPLKLVSGYAVPDPGTPWCIPRSGPRTMSHLGATGFPNGFKQEKKD